MAAPGLAPILDGTPVYNSRELADLAARMDRTYASVTTQIRESHGAIMREVAEVKTEVKEIQRVQNESRAQRVQFEAEATVKVNDLYGYNGYKGRVKTTEENVAGLKQWQNKIIGGILVLVALAGWAIALVGKGNAIPVPAQTRTDPPAIYQPR